MNQDYDDTRVVMGVCFGEKEMKENTERFKKVDEDVWDKVVQRMREKEKRKQKKL
jgi:hypothetical protein